MWYERNHGFKHLTPDDRLALAELERVFHMIPPDAEGQYQRGQVRAEQHRMLRKGEQLAASRAQQLTRIQERTAQYDQEERAAFWLLLRPWLVLVLMIGAVVAALLLAGCTPRPMALNQQPTPAPTEPGAFTPMQAPELDVADQAPLPTVAPTPAPAGTVPAWFDYRNPSTATTINPDDAYTVLGWAEPSWLYLRFGGGGMVWARAADLGRQVDPSLTNYTPRPPAPAAANPPAAPRVSAPAAPLAAAPAEQAEKLPPPQQPGPVADSPQPRHDPADPLSSSLYVTNDARSNP